MTERALTRTLRERTKYLKLLIKSVDQHLKRIDILIQQPSTPLRVGRIAWMCHMLDMANQHAKRFGLPTRKRKA